MRVVPGGAHCLFEGPRFAAFPFEFVAAEVVSEELSGIGLEEMPGANEVESGVRGAEATNVEDPDELPVGHEHVPGSEVPMGHHIGGFSW